MGGQIPPQLFVQVNRGRLFNLHILVAQGLARFLLLSGVVIVALVEVAGAETGIRLLR